MWKRMVSFFSLTMLFTMILGGIQQATGFVPMLSLPQFGPALGAVVTLLIFKKDKIRLNLKLPVITWKTLLFTVIIPFGAALTALLLSRLFNLTGDSPNTLPILAYVWIPFGAIGEEIGWRGYLHNYLNKKTAGLISSLIVGILWAAFHVQLYQNGPIYLLYFLLLITAYTIVIYPLMVRSNFNVLHAALYHSAINFSNLLYFNLLNETQFMLINALVWLVIAVFVILRNKPLFWVNNPTYSKSH